jgi:hypothetical protein
MGRPPEDAARRAIPAAVEAALWALSSGRCYAPGCPFPVIYEVRPGVYQKNAQIAHIVGVKRGAARYSPCPSEEEARDRESFKNLLLLCLAHHAEVDDKNHGEELYPTELLLKWKRVHEGEHGRLLNLLPPIDEDHLTDLLITVFTPPVTRLEKIADQLEQTGTLTSGALSELRNIITVMSDSPGGPDGLTARQLAYAAEVFESHGLQGSAKSLAYVAETLPSILDQLDRRIRELRNFG